MQTRIRKRILTVLLSAAAAVCIGGIAQAEGETSALFVQGQKEESPVEEVEIISVEEASEDVRGENQVSAEAGYQSPEEASVPEEEILGETAEAGIRSSGETSVPKEEILGETAEAGIQSSGETAAPEIQILGEAVEAEDLDAETSVLADADAGITASENSDNGITYLEERTFKSGDADDGAASGLFMRSTLEYERCYGDQLIGESRRIYDELVNMWGGGNTGSITYRLETQLPYSQTNVDQVYHNTQTAFDAFVYDYPEVFWLRDITVSIGRSSATNLLTSVFLNGNERYPGAKSEVSEFGQAVKSETDFIKGLIPEDADRYTVVKTIHDYICRTTEYDYQGINYRESNGQVYYDTSHTAAGIFLKDRIVVCEGYAKAFKILCQQFGIESALIIGPANGENHMWNYVKMDDGKWYLVDTTWDDQRTGLRDTYLLAGSMSYGFHGNLIMGERQSWTDFSGTKVKNFVLPVLSTYAYEQKEHQWQEISRTPATCRSYETAQYRCTVCGETKTEIVGGEVDHDWGPYVSNNDATWQKDGTKTSVCQYGCGETKTVTDAGSRISPFVKVNVSSLCLRVGQSTSAVEVTLAEGDKVVSWESGNPLIVTVNQNGKITAGMKVGEANVTFTTLSGMTRKITVTVQKKIVATTGITGLSQKITLKKGKKLQLNPVIEPITSLQKVMYSSSNKKIAAVNAKGIITAKKVGKVKITIKSGKKTFKITVKVKKA